MNRKKYDTLILGAGMSGLAAARITGYPVFEAGQAPGGICASYYIRPCEKRRLKSASGAEDSYRFEVGGGHWIFGARTPARKFIHRYARTRGYKRRSSVYFSKKDLYVPYPIQNNLIYLDEKSAAKAKKKIRFKPVSKTGLVMKDWLMANFGRTLCELFFRPFHELYTAGLYDRIMPQDTYKSPITRKRSRGIGYNASFIYPEGGLGLLAQNIARGCEASYSKRAVKIDPKAKEIFFADNSSISYKSVISSIPLNKMLDMSGLKSNHRTDPHTSVLVLNIGATKGKRCPSEHWLYVPDSRSGFFRIGFYSNVDTSFLPAPPRKASGRVSIYVEKAFMGGRRPSVREVKSYSNSVVMELRELGFIKEVEVLDPSWVDIAYTWSWPGSKWREEAIRLLRSNDIHQIGRYGRWAFQGIADSIMEGLNCKNYLT